MTLLQPVGAWASSLAQGDLQFITSVTGSAASAINVSGCFSATYDHYLVMRNLLGSAAGNRCDVRVRASSTDDSGANYRQQYVDAGSTTITAARATAQTTWQAALGYTETTSIGFAQLWISNPFGSVRTTAWSNQSATVTGNIELLSWVYEHDLATSYDGFSVIPSAGTITGTVYVYGLKV